MDFSNHTIMHLAQFVVHAEHDYGLMVAGDVATIASNKREKNSKLMRGTEKVNGKLFYWHIRTVLDGAGHTECVCKEVV